MIICKYHKFQLFRQVTFCDNLLKYFRAADAMLYKVRSIRQHLHPKQRFDVPESLPEYLEPILPHKSELTDISLLNNSDLLCFM